MQKVRGGRGCDGVGKRPSPTNVEGFPTLLPESSGCLSRGRVETGAGERGLWVGVDDDPHVNRVRGPRKPGGCAPNLCSRYEPCGPGSSATAPTATWSWRVPRCRGRHCRLTEIADGYLLEDLGSSNGTYVNGARIAAATRVSASDVITLGMKVPMSWPEATASPGARIVRIGRDADNDIVLDDPRVSSHHARLIVSGSQTLIEDRFAVGGSSLPAMPGGH